MRRLLLLVLAAGAIFTGPSFPSGEARTNEGTAVIILNPANPLPRGWSWK